MIARLLANEAETPTTRRLRVALDGGTFTYLAGQAAALSVYDCPPTPYSIASAPSETAREGAVEFLVKVDGATRFGSCVADLAVGTEIGIEGPTGRFTLDEVPAAAPLLFVAGGTGIAPLRSMIREALAAKDHGPIALVYSARTPPEFAFLNELRDLATERAIALTLTLTGESADWEHARGRTGPMHLTELIRAQTIGFICGPHMMVTDVSAALVSLGVPPERIRTEDW